MADSETPKIVVDSDWKSQARAEKERLAAAEKQKAAEKQAAKAAAPATSGSPGGARAADGSQGRLPPADFNSLLGSMITQALMYMGAFPDPESGRAVVSLEHAKFHIDLLAVLAEKVKGNITKEEEQDLLQAVSQLRLQFVELTKAVAQMAEERRAGRGGPGGAPFGGAEFGASGQIPGMPIGM